MDILLVLAYIIHASTPIILVSLGELVSEKSGVLNLGLEGMMMVGAFSGFYVGYLTGNTLLGIVAASLITGVFSLIHAFLTITLHSNQVVSGLALTFLGTGLASFAGRGFINISVQSLQALKIPLLSNVPILGIVFFNQNILVYFSYFVIFMILFYIYKTKPGIELQFCGESPSTSDTAGINITFVRYKAVIFGGMMAGLGGAFLTLADSSPWSDQITAGRGWIAVAIVIFGRWNPLLVGAGSYLFGSLNSLQFKLQARGIDISPYILGMLPYLFTIVILTVTSIKVISKRWGTPESLGTPYIREDRE